ncbi:MAG: hypothetical protein LBE33_03825 [Zoogloeaceae bacterium]|nr:hypothetical protein [Zoogloeaceae bacterium]
MRNFFWVPSIFLLFSCASISTQFTPFEEPASGDRAKVRVIGNALVKAIPGKNCVDWSTPGAGTVLGGIVGSRGFHGRSLGMPPGRDASKVDTAEFYAEAGKPITLVVMTTPEFRYECSATVSFIPEKDKNYEAQMMVYLTKCSADVITLDAPWGIVTGKPAKSC